MNADLQDFKNLQIWNQEARSQNKEKFPSDSWLVNSFFSAHICGNLLPIKIEINQCPIFMKRYWKSSPQEGKRQ